MREHSLSLSLAGILVVLFTLYSSSDSNSHLGAFYGNAVADWLGVFVFVVCTKYFFEIGSRESRPASKAHVRVGRFLVRHSLTLVLGTTAIGWAVLFAHIDVESKAGNLVGSIVSNWTQVLGLVLITKYARERGSKEGN